MFKGEPNIVKLFNSSAGKGLISLDIKPTFNPRERWADHREDRISPEHATSKTLVTATAERR